MPPTPTELIQQAREGKFTTKKGKALTLEFLPGLSPSEISKFESTLPCPLPTEIHSLLLHCRGFSGIRFGEGENSEIFVDFSNPGGFGFESVLPHGHYIAGDDCGNFWGVDLLADSKSWAPIYYVCHDPPVIIFQSPSLEHFLSELLKMNDAPFLSEVEEVHEVRAFEVWQHNPGVKSYEDCVMSSDPQLSMFAQQLDSSFDIIDLRNPEIGFGFSWGRYDNHDDLRRFGALPIFAYEKRLGFFQRLFGKSK